MTSRREFLNAAPLTIWVNGWSSPVPLRGVFPALDAPRNAIDRLDTEALAKEVEFLNRCGAHGVVWPPPICHLAPAERIAGAEIVMAAAKCPVILGVQGAEIEATRRYARHAEQLRPRAVMASPPGGLDTTAEHYRAIYSECGIPLMAHARPGVSLEFILRMRDEIPTLRLVKEEAGHTLSRISEYRRVAPELSVFISGLGRTMPDALERGAWGVMPPARFATAYLRIWNHCLAGRRDRAIFELSQVSLLVHRWGSSLPGFA